jgi:hypothetical protein
MKAVTLWQPWASLVAIGAKPYEFRKWAAPKAIVGQRIAIYAGMRAVNQNENNEMIIGIQRGDPIALRKDIALPFLLKVSLAAPMPRGCIVATAILGAPIRADKIMAEFGRVTNDSDRDGHFNFAWPMLDVEEMQPPIEAKGAQGFWDWTQ